MSSKHRRSRRDSSHRSQLRLEAMEPRVLLTTMELAYPGDTSVFIYRQGDSGTAFGGDLVRVELRNAVTGVGAIELIAQDPVTGLFTNIPGLLDWSEYLGGLAGDPCGRQVGAAPFTAENEILAIAADASGNLYGFANSIHVDNDPNLTFPPNSPAWGGTPPNPAPPDPYAAYDAAFLVSLSEGAGTATRLGVVQNEYTGDILPVPDAANGPFSEEQFVYNNITAADFDSAGNLWAIGIVVDKQPPNPTATPAQQYPPDAPAANNVPIPVLFRVDTTSQAGPGGGPNECWVMQRVALSDPNAQITSIAWDATTNRFYAYDANDDHLKIIMPTGVIADVAALTIAGSNPAIPVVGVTGLEFDETGTLYGVNGTNLIEIDKANGACTITGILGFANISSLAYDPTNSQYLWGIESTPGGADSVIRIYKKPPKPMDPFAIYVAEADQYTEICTTVVIRYWDNGWRYDDLRLWNAPTTPYISTYNRTDYYAPANSGGVMIGALRSPTQALPYRYKPVYEEYTSANVTQPIGLWPGSGTAGPLYAGITVEDGPATYTRGEHTGDLGYVLVGGTLAGRLDVPRSLEVAQVGLLYGSIDVGGDLRTVYIQTDFGAVMGGNTWFPYYDDVIDGNFVYANNLIHARGTITDINVRGTVYGTVVADGLAGIPDPSQDFVNWNNHNFEPIMEEEGRLPEILGTRAGFQPVFRTQFDYEDPTDPLNDPNQIDSIGFLSIVNPFNGRTTVTNNTLDTAQYLASETGSIILWGYLDDQPDEVYDYYALPLLAGQTVRIHGCAGIGAGENNPGVGIPGIGHVTDPREGYHPFLYDEAYNQVNLRLFSPNGDLMGTYGYETIEDQGIGSRGVVDEDLVFTAPGAGVYYIRIGDPRPPNFGGSDYCLFITGAAQTTLGGMRINGNYTPRFSPYFTVQGPENNHLYVGNGNLGAVNVVNGVLGLSANVERGSFLDFEAGTVGYTAPGAGQTTFLMAPVGLVARDDIGLVRSTTGSIVGGFMAGADTGNVRNNNASVQNVVSADDFGAALGNLASSGVIASGSIGRIQVTDYVSGASVFQVNSDQAGPAGVLDLAEVGGDWGDPLGRPSLYHGPDGNIRFIRVGGTIYEDYGGWIGPLEPTVLTGTAGIFADDGGATMTISPTTLTTDNGPGVPPTVRTTTVKYWIMDVDDAVGGVMARFETDGGVSFTMAKAQSTTGTIEICDFLLAGTQAIDTISVKGTSKTPGEPNALDIYYLHGSAIASFTNSTAGDIVAGNLQGIQNLVTGGSIGYTENATRAWLGGVDPRPAADPVAFGWFEGRLNGVQITGDTVLVQAGGSLGDLYVTGTVDSIVVNADRVTPAGGWDGVRGTVYAGTHIGSLNLGDGLMDDGSADHLQAAVLSNGTIGTVTISRRYEVLNNQFMGLVNGSIMAHGDITSVIGTNGARFTGIIACKDFIAGLAWGTGTRSTGGVGTVSFSGVGAAIYDAEIAAEYIGTVKTSPDSLGIWGCFFSGDVGRPSAPTIGLIEAGGAGLRSSVIGATGGSIGTIRTNSAQGDILENIVESTDSLAAMITRNIYGNDVRIPNMLTTLTATGNMNANAFNVGGLRTTTVTGDVLGNIINVAGPVTTFTVGGRFSSQLTLQGPRTATMGTFTVVGPIAGTIISAGKIGQIVSTTGNITADIRTTEDAINGDIDLIQSPGTFEGNLSVSGNLGILSTMGSVGKDPETIPSYEPTVINVSGNFATLIIGGKGKKGVPVGPLDLYSDLNIGGNVGTMSIGGGLFGDTVINGNLTSLTLLGDIGREFSIPLPVVRGNVEVRGNVGTISMAPGTDIIADFVTGGDLASITLVNGSIGRPGDPVLIQSLFGDIKAISVTGGSIYADLLANMSIGGITVVGGTLGTPAAPVTIETTHGGIGPTGAKKSSKTAAGITVSGGGIFTDGITAGGGGISSLSVTGGNIDGTPGAKIQALMSIGTLTVTNGSLNVDVAAGNTVGSVLVTGGNLTGDISGDMGVNSVVVSGDIAGAVIRSGGAIGGATTAKGGAKIKLPKGGGAITANNILNSTISAATNISSIAVLGNVDGTTIMAGYDVGPDCFLGSPDDNPLTGGAARSGNVTTISVGGNWINSVVAAGVVPVGGSFLAATTPAPGQSSLGTLTILGDVTGVSGVVADTSVGTIVTGVPNDADLQRIVLDSGNPVYDAMPQAAVKAWTGNVGGVPATITLVGPGFFKFNPATGQLAIDGTTSASSLSLVRPKGALIPVPIPIQITGGDDDGLASLTVGAGITLGNTNLDGTVLATTLNGIAANSDLNFLGGLGSFTNAATAALTNVDLFIRGPLAAYRNSAPFASGSLTADSLPAIANVGDLGANISTPFGGIAGLTVTNGTLTGSVMSRGSVTAVRVTGPAGAIKGQFGLAITGNIMVTNGDLGALAASGDVTGNISVPRGGIASIAITGGDFSNLADPADINAIRSQTGLPAFSITGGDFSALLFTDGALGTFSIRTGVLHGRVIALDGIGTVTITATGTPPSPFSGHIEGMRNGLIASGSDISRLTITGDVVDSYIFAGFNPNDDGYDADTNRDDGWIDAFTTSVDDTIPPDEVWGGTITSATVTGDFVRSAMSAGVGPGLDGYVGNDDDVVAGTGYILAAAITGRVEGSAGNEAYGFSAATSIGRITVGGQPLGTTGNVVNRPRIDPPGPPHVEQVSVSTDRLSIVFDQPINLSTIRTAWFNGIPATLNLYVSQDRFFDPLTSYNVATEALHAITYDDATSELTLILLGQTWTTLNEGTNFLLVLDSSVVSDASGELLDGDYLYTLPSGDGVPGGDFIYRFEYGDQGDTTATALDLLSEGNRVGIPDDLTSTSDLNVPMLVANTPSSWPGSIRLTGEIGDNPALTGQQRPDDVDCFKIDATVGDILYVNLIATAFVLNVGKYDPAVGDYVLDFPDSLTGQGYYTEADTTYLLVVANDPFTRAVGSYELLTHLFNDHNSNFPGVGSPVAVGSIGFDGISSLTLSSSYGGTPTASIVGAVDGYSNISAIGMDTWNGDLFAVDNGSGRIIEIDMATGQPTPSASLPAGYTDVHAMEFEPFGGWFWAVGRNPANQLVLLDVSAWSGTIWSEYTIQPGTINDISSIALDPADPFGDLYGVNPDTNELVLIDTSFFNGGDVTVVGTLWDPAAAQPIAGVTGITFDDRGTLYALAPNMLYKIDPATALATGSYAISLNAPTSLAFDMFATDLTLWATDASGAEDSLVRIDFEPALYAVENTTNQLLTIDPVTGQGSVLASLPAGYHDIQGLDLNVTLTSDDLWAIGRNPANALVLIRLDAATAAVLEEHAITPGTITQIGSIAFNSSGVLFGADTTNNALITIDETTGATTLVGPLLDADNQPITGVTGIEFDANDTLHAVTPTTMYTIDSTTGKAVLSAPLPTTGLSALAFGFTLGQSRLWSVDASTNPDTLVTISLAGDPTQTPTLLTFDTNGVAQPEKVDRDGHLVQVITAPDDVDVYSLGQLAAGTHIDVTLLTRTIGDHILADTVTAGVFNSNQELVASLYMPPYAPIGGTLPLDAYLDNPVISVNLPGNDTYYVAVWGGDSTLIDDLLPYDLSVAISAPDPAPRVQTVFLNFNGGTADYLLGDFGPATNTYLSPLDATAFGFYGPTDRQTLINKIVADIKNTYDDYSNITFTTARPLFGEYSTILIGGNVAPEIGTFGIAQQIDSMNRDLTDMAVVFGGELANFYNSTLGYSMDDAALAIANTASHELGHLLGLNHQLDTALTPPWLIMSYADPVDPAAFGRGPLDSFLIGYQNDSVLLRVVA